MKYILTLFLVYGSNFFAGFAPDTLIKTAGGFCQIQDLQISDQLLSFDSQMVVSDIITDINITTIENSIQIDLHGASIVSSSNQCFYLPETRTWRPASDLKSGDYLLTSDNTYLPVLDVRHFTSVCKTHDLTVQKNHNFFVSKFGILVHNEPITLGLMAVAGSAKAAVMTGYALKVAITGLFVFCCQRLAKSNRPANPIFPASTLQYKSIDLDKQIPSINDEFADKKDAGKDEAQAPGKPTESDGFIPKKNWDGKKVKHRRGWGWPDRSGNVWIPTGPNGHGGPHWDVQMPNGDYENIVPGGGIRGQK